MCFCKQLFVYVDQKDALQEAQMEGAICASSLLINWLLQDWLDYRMNWTGN